jgi:hypothetical protein
LFFKKRYGNKFFNIGDEYSMRKMYDKYICGLIILVLTISLITIPILADDGIKVQLNGVQLNFDVQPQLIDSRTMVPMRKIFETLGATVEWYNEAQVAVASKGDIIIELKIGSTIMIKNKQAIFLDVPPQVIDGRTLVPVRAVAESFDAEVKWDENTKTVLISEEYESGVTPTPTEKPISSESFSNSIDIKDAIAKLGIQIIQNNKIVNLTDKINEIKIKKDTFAFRFNSSYYTEDKPYGYCIDVFDSNSHFNSTFEGEKTGVKAIDDDGVFAGGKGMALYNRSCEAFVVNSDGFHYIFYQDADDYRATLIKDDKGSLILECNIKQIYDYSTEETLDLVSCKYNELYIMFYYDTNLNSIIDEGELVKLKLMLE